jgi:hypothetical protein
MERDGIATMVLKPAETVCPSVLEFMEEMADIIPPGIVNVITGDGEDVGQALVAHPEARVYRLHTNRSKSDSIRVSQHFGWGP